MRFADTLLPEFDVEMKTTRTMLERIPFEQDVTRPSEKSRTLVELGSHIANLVALGSRIVESDERDILDPAGAKPDTYDSQDALLGASDRHVAASRQAIVSLDDTRLGDTWTIRAGSKVVIALPRAAALRTLLMSHMIHHRGQLSAYLRLNNIPHPPIYGPTAETDPRR